MSVQTNAAAVGCCRPFRVVENLPANVFLDSFSHQWCQSRLFSMPVTVPAQPTHNTVCSRFLSLIFSLVHYLQGCKFLGRVCFVVSVQLHALKYISQITSKDLYYKCHGAVPLTSLGHALVFLNSYRLLIVQKALCIYKSINCKSWNGLLHILGFAALYFSDLLNYYLLWWSLMTTDYSL